MKLKIEKRIFPDGIERGVLMFRNHWWEGWRPLQLNGQVAYVSYMGGSCRSLQDECFDMLGLSEEQRKAREAMQRFILDADEVYIGARVGEEYYVGYDVYDDASQEVLRNLEG